MSEPQSSPGFQCSKCGEHHPALPIEYGTPIPDLAANIPPDEMSERCQRAKDHCVVDGEYSFIHGRLEIPILENDQKFCWNVWASLSKASFDHWQEQRKSEQPASTTPYFGWLCTRLPGYPQTLNLKMHVHTATNPITVELEPTDHPLAIEQRDGNFIVAGTGNC